VKDLAVVSENVFVISSKFAVPRIVASGDPKKMMSASDDDLISNSEVLFEFGLVAYRGNDG